MKKTLAILAILSALAPAGTTLVTGASVGGAVAIFVAGQNALAATPAGGTGSQSDPYLFEGGGAATDDIDLSVYGASEYVELNTTDGHFVNADNSHTGKRTISANVIIQSLILDDGYGNSQYYFTGTVSGTGNFEYKMDRGSAQTWIFEGDTRDWSGSIDISRSSPFTIGITGGGTVGLTSVRGSNGHDNAGTLNVGNSEQSTSISAAIQIGELNVADSARNVTFGGSVNTTTLNVNSGAEATFGGSVTASNLNISSGAASVQFDESVNVSGVSYINSSATFSAGLTAQILEVASGSTVTLSGVLDVVSIASEGNLVMSGDDNTLRVSVEKIYRGNASVSQVEGGGYSITYWYADKSKISGNYSIETNFSDSITDVAVDSTESSGYVQATVSQSYQWKGWGAAAAESSPNLLELGRLPQQEAGSAFEAGNGNYAIPGGNGMALLDYIQDGSLNVYGGRDSAPTGTESARSDSWIYVDGAKLGLVIGGNYANNWSSGTQADFYGNSHINLVGGAEINYVIGANYKDGDGSTDRPGAALYGDTYISISEDSRVLGSVIGGGTTAHNDTASVVGNTNVWVYSPLETTSSTSLPALDNLTTQQFVAGGGAWTTNSGGNVNVSGDSAVNIILKDYAGSLTTFGKKVMGGSFGGESSNGCVIIHGDSSAGSGGNTSVTIDAGDKAIRFTAAVIGGSNTLRQDKAITQHGKAEVSITGGSYEQKIVGGHYIEATEGSAAAALTEGASVSILSATVDGAVYGGTYTANNGAVSQGNTSVSLGEGAVVNSSVYAAGGKSAESTATMTTSGTKLAISAGAIFGSSPITLSGGYENASQNTTVTGAATLATNGTGNVDLSGSNIRLEAFTTAEVVEGSTLNIGSKLAASGITSKTGAGTLAISGANTGASLTVSAGSLSVTGGTSVQQLTFGAGTTLAFDMSANGASSFAEGTPLLTLHALTLAGAGLTIDLSAISSQFTTPGVYELIALDSGSTVPAGDISVTGLAPSVIGSAAWSGTSLVLNTALVPEPATATLSLLALAGLCARRRRCA